MTDLNTAAIEALRSFALNYATNGFVSSQADLDNRLHLAAFARMCTAALNGEEWAVERIDEVIENIDYMSDRGPMSASQLDALKLENILATDVTRPEVA